MHADDERARGFGVAGDDEGLGLRGYDEHRTKVYRLARAAVTSVLPGGEVLATLVDFEQERQVRIANELVDGIVVNTGVESLLRRVVESEEVAAGFRQAVDAATRTGYEAKRRLLAQVISEAVLDDAKIDEDLLLIAALRDLEAPHLRTLEAMSRAVAKVEEQSLTHRSYTPGVGPSPAERFESSVIAQIQHDTAGVPRVVIAGLARVGAIEGRGTYGSMNPVRPEHFRITDFGRALLRHLDEAREMHSY